MNCKKYTFAIHLLRHPLMDENIVLFATGDVNKW
jgi:hypothetical protein